MSSISLYDGPEFQEAIVSEESCGIEVKICSFPSMAAAIMYWDPHQYERKRNGAVGVFLSLGQGQSAYRTGLALRLTVKAR